MTATMPTTAPLHLVEFYTRDPRTGESGHDINFVWLRCHDAQEAAEALTRHVPSFGEIITCEEQASVTPLAGVPKGAIHDFSRGLPPDRQAGATAAPDTTRHQRHGRWLVNILVHNRTGHRLADIRDMEGTKNAFTVPIDLLPHAAGKDEWMRNIWLRCTECRAITRAGDRDAADYCQACFDQQGEENAKADRGEA